MYVHRLTRLAHLMRWHPCLSHWLRRAAAASCSGPERGFYFRGNFRLLHQSPKCSLNFKLPLALLRASCTWRYRPPAALKVSQRGASGGVWQAAKIHPPPASYLPSRSLPLEPYNRGDQIMITIFGPSQGWCSLSLTADGALSLWESCG